MILSKPRGSHCQHIFAIMSSNLQCVYCRDANAGITIAPEAVPVGAGAFDLRITENNLLATAAPAIVTRMITRNSARKVWPWLPPEKSVEEEPTAIVADYLKEKGRLSLEGMSRVWKPFTFFPSFCPRQAVFVSRIGRTVWTLELTSWLGKGPGGRHGR